MNLFDLFVSYPERWISQMLSKVTDADRPNVIMLSSNPESESLVSTKSKVSFAASEFWSLLVVDHTLKFRPIGLTDPSRGWWHTRFKLVD